MRIDLKNNGKRIIIPVPNRLLYSRFVFRILEKKTDLKEWEWLKNREICEKLRRLTKECLKKCKGLTLVEIESSDGSKVKIRI